VETWKLIFQALIWQDRHVDLLEGNCYGYVFFARFGPFFFWVFAKFIDTRAQLWVV
jgi:hypothetical protein